jgi:thiol-activated cytolysin
MDRLTVFGMLLCISCNIQLVEGADDDDGGAGGGSEEGQGAASLDDFVYGLGRMPLPEEVAKTEISCLSDCGVDGQEGHDSCTYRSYTETRHFDEVVAFQPNSATLWPGAVVRGRDAVEGLLTPVSVELAPVTFSVSLENTSGSPVGRMDSPSLSAFREERNRILAGDLSGSAPANVAFEISQVHSSTQLSLELGGSVSWFGGSVGSTFDFNSSEAATKVLIDFVQAYYTIDVDTKSRPSSFFGGNVTVDALSQFANQESPPLYVQSITYGRRVIFSLETSETYSDIAAAVSASFDAIMAGGEGSLSSRHKNMLSESKMKALIVGGNGTDAVGAINGIDGLKEYILSGGEYAKDSPGAPIAYKLAYLDNSIARLAFASDYTERVCFRNRATVTAQLLNISGEGDYAGSELLGDVFVYLPNEMTSGGCEAKELATQLKLLDYAYWYGGPLEPQRAYDVPAGEGKSICLFAQMWDDDWTEYEFLGSDAVEISWSGGWSGVFTLNMTSSEGWAKATVNLDIE